ncbi:hypothetical protein Murmansk-051 [Murmansk poxvirus]|uniref:Protein OPG061 n=1 Tax=Murmansk poxvirus TaxID=2025359 RepID=A0A223FMM6_9POXV|nr:hypothetical protein CKM52_gp051 [Murmansk poxvirus]AST09246.1 hypothetical protein Murmansk-051 [Murmansk poxvirus]
MKVAIITSISSLLDASICFQKTACKHHCKYYSFEIVKVLDDIGYISENTLQSDEWKELITNEEIDGLVFYRVKQINISVGDFHNMIMQHRSNPIIMHFVRDCLIFDGDPPSFRTSTSAIKSYNRRKIKDLILLMNMKTCNKNIISEFIETNFGSVDVLLTIVNSNIIWVTSVINKESKKQQNILTIMKFKRFINKIKMYNKSNKQHGQIDEICSSIDKMGI